MKALRITLIVLMSITAVFMLLGGIGTSCVALDAAKFGDSMAPIAPFQWLYKIFVVLTAGSGLAGIWAVIGMFRKKRWGFYWAIGSLLVGTIVGGIHMFVSESLRGSSAPANMVFYFTAFTLLMFIIARLTPVSKVLCGEEVDDAGGPSGAGAALFVTGVLTITTPIWAMPTHILVGVNWVNVLLLPLLLIGMVMIFTGLLLLTRGIKHSAQKRKLSGPIREPLRRTTG